MLTEFAILDLMQMLLLINQCLSSTQSVISEICVVVLRGQIVSFRMVTLDYVNRGVVED